MDGWRCDVVRVAAAALRGRRSTASFKVIRAELGRTQWINTSFMQLTTVVQAFENIVLCAGDGGRSWGGADEGAEEE